MDYQKSLSCPKTFSSKKQKYPSSDEEDGNECSWLERNELESLLVRYDEIPCTLDASNICPESQQHSFQESEQGNSLETENDDSFSMMSSPNENTSLDLTSDVGSFFPEQENLFYFELSNCLLNLQSYLPDENVKELGVSGTTLTIVEPNYELESISIEPNTTSSDSPNVIENSPSTSNKQTEAQSVRIFSSSLNDVYSAKNHTSNKDALSGYETFVPSAFEGSGRENFHHRINFPKGMGNIGSCGFSSGQNGDGNQFTLRNSEEPNQISPSLSYQASAAKKNNHRNSGDGLVSVNNTEAVAGVSSLNETQWYYEDGRFICTECGKGFDFKSRLLIHYRTHTGEKPFSCDKCDQRFSVKCNLSAHMRIHTGEKPYSCNMCEYKCSHPSNLQNHLRTHTGEKPHECPVCKRTFNYASSRNRHYRDVHNGK